MRNSVPDFCEGQAQALRIFGIAHTKVDGATSNLTVFMFILLIICRVLSAELGKVRFFPVTSELDFGIRNW